MSVTEIKVLNYNCWHALTAKNLIQFRELEPVGRKHQRYQLQLDYLKKLNADIVFLQEVSPIEDRLSDFEALGYDACLQVDQSGVKVFGIGLPENLSTGLVILAKPEFNMKKLFGQKLSGGPGFAGVDFSFHFSENRYALFAESSHAKFGRTLFVCTHLHHGTENSPFIEDKLKAALAEGILNDEEYEISKSEIKAADQRRKNELEVLFSVTRVFEKNFDQVILAGDFNSSESSQAYTQVLFENYVDTYRNKNAEAEDPAYPGYTWDISRNAENIQYGHAFELPMSSFGRSTVTAMFNEYNDRKRRIDFIFLKNLRQSIRLKILHSKLIDFADLTKGLLGSDHLALQTSIGVRSSN